MSSDHATSICKLGGSIFPLSPALPLSTILQGEGARNPDMDCEDCEISFIHIKSLSTINIVPNSTPKNSNESIDSLIVSFDSLHPPTHTRSGSPLCSCGNEGARFTNLVSVILFGVVRLCYNHYHTYQSSVQSRTRSIFYERGLNKTILVLGLMIGISSRQARKNIVPGRLYSLLVSVLT